MSRTWRLVAVGVVFAALFAVLTLRLWYLQMSTVASALEVAEQQQLRVVTVEAPRGDIYDRNGQELLAATLASRRIVVDRALLPEEREEELVNNLAALLGMPAQNIWALFEENEPGARFAVGDEVSESTAVFALEHIEDFPGVVVESVPVRIYPQGETAAHLVGYIGAPADDDLLRPGITARDRVGRFGIEKEYDRLLRGTPGKTTYRVNAGGEILGIVEEVPPQAGGTVITTIDLGLQRFVEQALFDGMSLARLDGKFPARASAVVIDPRDGSVLAMASVPAYDPGLFSDGRITDQEWAALSETAALNNFAIQGLYPPASAFKVVAYTLALEEDIYPTEEQDQYAALLDPNDPTSFYADGDLQFPNTPLLRDWKVHGLVNIHTSLQVSSDNYYWGIALEIWDRRGLDWDENILQDWARELGFGEATGIDLPFEQVGIVPDWEWFQYNQLNQTGLVRLEGPWSGGDLMNVAIGQGAMVCTPLQLANAYAALVNGGTLWTPRVVSSIIDSEGDVILLNVPGVNRVVDISESTVASLRADLHGVVASENGTAYQAFVGFGDSLGRVGGKTGTAQIRLASHRVVVDRNALPAGAETRVIDRLAELLETPAADIRERFATEETEFSVADDISDATATLIQDNLWDLPGVVVEDVPEIDTAWFVGVAPLDAPEFVVAVVIDGGGSGGKIAAPTARAILQYLMGEDVDTIRSGEDTD
ncbi:MAG TPA: penicillin-binding transpeptidase domain-containing protein [Acidimicrobiia bacterium]|nr:penicillin-binding transpeptidase domain-containing protein [Acidimicrobiia bacterium]